MADDDRVFNKTFGVVLFDDPKQPQAGWKRTAGKQHSCERISSPDELSTGTIWLTNIDYNDFFNGSEIWRRSNLRHEAYLVVKMKNILMEWNYNPGKPGQQSLLSPNFICDFISDRFNLIMHVAFRLIRQVDPRMTMDRAFTGQSLRDDFRLLLPELDFPRGEAASIMKADKSYQEFTSCNPRFVRDASTLMVRRPRTLHALEMLQTPVPLGPWEFVPRRNFKKYGSDIVSFIRDTDMPCFVELDVERIDPEVGPVYGFSNTSNKQAKHTRSWVSHNEFQALVRYADVNVRGFYAGREYGSLVDKFPDPVREFLTDRTLDSSWTAGIIAETIWRAATQKEGSEKAGKRSYGEDRAGTSWEGAWIRGQDKVSMFMKAWELHKRDYPIASYGLGWVSVRVTDEARNDFVNDALSVGLIPGMSDIAEGQFNESSRIEWGGDKRSTALAQYLASKNTQMLWNLDKVPTIPPGERRPFIKKLMEYANKIR